MWFIYCFCVETPETMALPELESPSEPERPAHQKGIRGDVRRTSNMQKINLLFSSLLSRALPPRLSVPLVRCVGSWLSGVRLRNVYDIGGETSGMAAHTRGDRPQRDTIRSTNCDPSLVKCNQILCSSPLVTKYRRRRRFSFHLSPTGQL